MKDSTKMTLIDFDKKELLDIYRALQYTRLEIQFEISDEEELYDRLTKLMDKVAKLRQVYLQGKCIRVNTFAPLRLTYNTDEIVVWYDSNPKTTESHADM